MRFTTPILHDNQIVNEARRSPRSTPDQPLRRRRREGEQRVPSTRNGRCPECIKPWYEERSTSLPTSMRSKNRTMPQDLCHLTLDLVSCNQIFGLRDAARRAASRSQPLHETCAPSTPRPWDCRTVRVRETVPGLVQPRCKRHRNS